MSKLLHVAISVTDLESSVTWYTQFGFTEYKRWKAKDGSLIIAHLGSEAGDIELLWQPDVEVVPITDELAGGLAKSGLKHFCIETSDLDGDLKRLGNVKINPTTEVKKARSIPRARYVFFRDPDGNWVELMQRSK